MKHRTRPVPAFSPGPEAPERHHQVATRKLENPDRVSRESKIFLSRRERRVRKSGESAAPSGCFRRPPGITFRTVPLVGDDIGRILRTHRCCAKAGVGSLGTRPSNRKFTSNTICPSALRTFLKMFRVDHGVHSELPFVGGSTGVSLCRWRLLVSCLRYSLYRKSTDFN